VSANASLRTCIWASMRASERLPPPLPLSFWITCQATGIVTRANCAEEAPAMRLAGFASGSSWTICRSSRGLVSFGALTTSP
jgi:hypothetical protein